MRLPTVLIADDHTIVMDGLVALLKDKFDVVGAVSDGSRLVDEAIRLKPDVIVTDISMPGMSGMDALRRLKALRSDTRIILLTMHANAAVVTEAMHAGASGYLLKQSAGDELVSAIHEVLQGRVYLTPALTQGVIAGMAGAVERAADAADPSPAPGAEAHRGRTPDEGDRRDPGDLDADGRNPQVRDDAGTWRAIHGRTGATRHQAATGGRVRPARSACGNSVVLRTPFPRRFPSPDGQ